MLRASLRLVGFAAGLVSIGSLGASLPAAAQIGVGWDIYVTGWNTDNIGAVSIESPGTIVQAYAGGDLDRPHSIRLSPGGSLIVANFGSNEVLLFAFGNALGPFCDTSALGILGPTDAIYGPDGHLYVGGLNSGGVGKFDGVTGAPLEQFVPPGQNNLTATEMMEWGPDGNLYVCSPATNNVKVYAPDGTFQGNAFAAGLGGLADPHHCLFLPSGNLLVTSFGTGQVLEYDLTNGTFVGLFASGLSGPHAMYALSSTVLVTSFFGNSIEEYDFAGVAQGTWLNTLPTVGAPTHLVHRFRSTDTPGPVAIAGMPLVSPNPSRALQWIRWPDAGPIQRELEIVDAGGRRVRTLIGTGDVAWDGRDEGGRPVAAGVYFLRGAEVGGAPSRLVRLR